MADLACPQCRKPLVAIEHGDLRGDACHDCGGIWLSTEITKRVGQALDPTSIALGEEASAMATEPFPRHGYAPPCPACAAPMRSLAVPSTKIELDTCTLHGTWMDRGELETMVRTLSARRRDAIAAATLAAAGDAAPVRSNESYARPSEPSVAADVANAALGVAGDIAASVAVDVAFGLLGAFLTGNRRR
ncbi:MAG TPA: zf-TFIIB domain-containing protein [Polyangiaceae bacterium]